MVGGISTREAVSDLTNNGIFATKKYEMKVPTIISRVSEAVVEGKQNVCGRINFALPLKLLDYLRGIVVKILR